MEPEIGPSASYVERPPGIETQIPGGLALELLLIEIQQTFRSPAFPFSIRPRRFDLAMDEALAVVRLEDEGYPETAAWWLAREASVRYCLDELREPNSSL